MKRILLVACMLGAVLPAFPQKPAPAADSPRVEAFEELLLKGQRSIDSLTADDIVKLLSEGRDLGRPNAVSGVVRTFLSRHADPAPGLLRLAAQNAMLVGEYRLAAARYRQFFRNAPVTPDSSQAAGEFFQMLTDYMAQGDDAFAANSEIGDTHRQAALAKKYDGWFLETCWNRRATGAMAKRLATLFAEKWPLDQERFAYWHQLDRLTDRLASLHPGNAEAILPGRALVPLIREDAVRAARLAFFIENIAFHETRAGKDAAALEREFEKVLAAARAYLDLAPTEQTLRHIMTAFGGGVEQPSDPIWAVLAGQKQAFFAAYGFSKLPEAEQIRFLNWNWWAMPARLASSGQWIELGAKHPQAFQKAGGTARLPWVAQTTNAALYKAQAPILTGHLFPNAVMISAMAAGTDANSSIQHLLTQAAWQMPFVDRSRNPNVEVFPDLAYNQLIPAWANLKAPAAGPERDAFINEAQLAFMEGPLFSSAMTPFSHGHVRHALLAVWPYCSQNAARRDRYIALLGKLAWVPFLAERRDKVIEPALNEFRRWSQETRKQFDALAGKTEEESVNKRKELEAVINQIPAIEAAFKQASETAADPAKAPNPHCRDIASLVLAVAAEDAAAYAAAAKSLYASVREYQKNKTPFGEALMELLMTPRGDKLNCIGQQMEILADQIGLRLTDPAQHRGASACVRMLATRNGWRFDGLLRPRNEDNELRDTIANVFAKAIEARTAKDQWDYELFNWYRGVLRQESEQAQAVVSAIIDRDIFTKNNVSMWHASPTCSYMALLRNEIPSLQGKYPLATWFDERMAAEFKRTGVVDETYWTYGHDRLKVVVNAAAELFTANTSYLPFLGSPTVPAVYSRDQYFAISGRVLGADGPLVSAYMNKIQGEYGKTRFDGTAAGSVTLSGMPATTPELRNAFFGKLREYTSRAKDLPYHLGMPHLPQVNDLQLGGTKPLTDDELTALAECFRHVRWTGWTGTEERWIQLLHGGLTSRGRMAELISLVPDMWRIAFHQNRRETMLMLAGFASALMDADAPVPAATYSVTGLEIAASRLPEDIRNSLIAIRTKAQSQVGGSLMVERTDRRYPILAAQALYHVGRLESAWEHYLQAPDLAITEFKDLDLSFTIWLVERRTTLGQYDEAEQLGRTLIQWMDAAPQGFDPETRAQMLIAYADIAFTRQEYPRARAQYDRVVVAREFEGTLGAKRAELKIAEVDRMTKQYDAAIDRLDKLDRQRDTMIQAEARYQMALIKFDQEDFGGARDLIARVFAIAPNHAQAGLLEGKINVRTRKLIEATEVKIGLSDDQRTIIPGRPLKVSLEDRTLAIVGKTADLEIRAWTDSGDEEHFLLFPFGDSKTRFRGEIATALAPMVKKDNVLQVLGRDKVHYGFSERFRKAAGLAADETVSIEVITDGELYASSGIIEVRLTREQREQRDLEEKIRREMKLGEAKDGGEKDVPLSTIRTNNEVKPGNPIYIRVVDPDRSTTPGKDTVTVRATTSSGDVVERLMLTETETHSGVFEGKLITASAPATAFASDTEEGRQANFVISGDANLPPWVGLGDKNRNKLFSIDLNNNITLGALALTADVPGKKLKRFIVQTSMNGTDYTTAAAWPDALPSWDGTLRLRMVRYDAGVGAPTTVKAYKDYFDHGYLAYNLSIQTAKGKVADDLRQSIRLVEGKLGLRNDQAPGSWALAHLQGTFYVPERRNRTFKIDAKNRLENVAYILAVDGKSGLQAHLAVDGKSGLQAHELTVSLAKGYHTIDLYAAVHSQTQAAYELLWDVEEEPYEARIPEAAFTPAQWLSESPPAGIKAAEMKVNADGTRFDLAFAPDTRARVVRFNIFDFESDAPAIRKVGLTAADGKTILPVAQDVLALRKNQELEIVPGDRITVAYEDPSVINRERQTLEVFLTATFFNASVGAYLIETMVDPTDNMRKPLFVPIRRYKVGDVLSVFVLDADADETEALDKVEVQVRTTGGKQIKLTATETDKNSGIFITRFFPVSGAPKRDTEITVEPGDDIEISYRDEKNTDYGVPWDRVATLQYVIENTRSQLRVYDYTSRALSSNELAAATARSTISEATGELLVPTHMLTAVRPISSQTEEPAKLAMGAPLIVELLNPSLAVSPLSAAEVLVQIVPKESQTPAADPAAARQPPAFDPSLPGTIRYRMGLTDVGDVGVPIGYAGVTVVDDKFAIDPVEDGRFTFTIPTALGALSQMNTSTDLTEITGPADRENVRTISTGCLDEKGRATAISRSYVVPPLFLRPSDRIRIAINHAGPQEPPRWEVQETHLMSDSMLDVMDQRYQKPMDLFNVGDSLYLRVIDAMADTTMAKDEIAVTVTVNTKPERTQTLKLMETFENTGVFKGKLQILFEGVSNENPMPDTVAVPYGATITLKYSRPDAGAIERKVMVNKGADGTVLPFTKRFADAEIAVQTQFTMAEAYFEMAKKYRALKEEEVARRTIAQGKKLLEEAIRDYPKTQARVQADYLLANLAYESAEQTEDEELAKRLFIEAVTRFSDVIAGYPDSEYAPKSQFKKALVFERMGQIDVACEEYVKLSYRYPENELVAETIARLGTYFSTKGREIESRLGGESDLVKRETGRLQAHEFYRTAAQVFARLSVRFPDHNLAAKTKVLSAENWLRAKEHERAAVVYEEVIAEKKGQPELIAQAMYWCGDTYLQMKKPTNAYRMLKRLTWDYPESIWAKYARGRLTEPALAAIDLSDKGN